METVLLWQQTHSSTTLVFDGLLTWYFVHMSIRTLGILALIYSSVIIATMAAGP